VPIRFTTDPDQTRERAHRMRRKVRLLNVDIEDVTMDDLVETFRKVGREMIVGTSSRCVSKPV
jgi:hypothetical protein